MTPMNRRNRNILTAVAQFMAESGVHLIVIGPDGPLPIAPEAIPGFIERGGVMEPPAYWPLKKTGRPAKNQGAQA
jgi:hypothetical protein